MFKGPGGVFPAQQRNPAHRHVTHDDIMTQLKHRNMNNVAPPDRLLAIRLVHVPPLKHSPAAYHIALGIINGAMPVTLSVLGRWRQILHPTNLTRDFDGSHIMAGINILHKICREVSRNLISRFVPELLHYRICQLISWELITFKESDT